MTQTSTGAGPHVTLYELPDAIRSLEVAGALVEAGMTSAEVDHLGYIVDQVYFIGEEWGERLLRFSILIVLSTMIAAFGLLADSVAVVIGAMLVAPLMTPIMGTAVSLVLTESRRLAASVRTVAGGAVGAIAVGWLISLIASGGITTNQGGLTDLELSLILSVLDGLMNGLGVRAGGDLDSDQFGYVHCHSFGLDWDFPEHPVCEPDGNRR
jgi:hypothetical protein